MKSFLTEIIFGASHLDGGSRRARRAFKLARLSFFIVVLCFFLLLIQILQ
tara:strand:- start:301 stop:450 length:150 start_codon:yes stop_codon:yes gene_type:complete